MFAEEKTPNNQILAFKSLLSGIIADCTPITDAPVPDETTKEVKWNVKTLPPTLAPVALADAQDDPIIRQWLSARVIDIEPEIKYRADQLYNLGRLYNMEKEDARQEMSAHVLARTQKDPQWALEDNALLAYDATMHLRPKQRDARNWAQRNLAFSLDEPTNDDTELTRLDSIMTTRAKVTLTHFPLYPTSRGWTERPDVVLESDLWPAMRELRPMHRNVFLLSKFYGMRLADIAKRYGIAHGTARSHNARAKNVLRLALPHLDYNRIVPQCPKCGNRALRKPSGSEKTRQCQTCNHTAPAGEFDTAIQDRPYYLGRHGKDGIAPVNWLRTLAENYPIAQRQKAEPHGPTIPREDTPTIRTVNDWTPEDIPSPEPWKWDGTLSNAMRSYRAQFAPQ